MSIMQRIRTFCGLSADQEGDAALTPDVKATVEMTKQVAEELRDASAKVNAKLETYLKADQPFIAMMIDAHNERARKKQLEQWDRE